MTFHLHLNLSLAIGCNAIVHINNTQEFLFLLFLFWAHVTENMEIHLILFNKKAVLSADPKF